ncbi:hypothetical protein ANCCEY_13220 [Ancylostoma ceylanicum]|uniref:Elongator complex protein 5 n=2 Tax=Ancylostoma ceylanicum TaxID=53326 RepID=A0A0D6L9A2_9BILA|nr:hypothetical protein ANCCEY_13220 [Ancylostoma ceylanicum]EYC35782.1 hypothetical protein Y032_0985g3292 [Ancylostoma ceylanicum]
MVLSKFTLDGLALFRDNRSCYAEPLAFALVRSTPSLVVVTIPGRDTVLKSRYASVCERAVFVFLSDESSLEAIHQQIISSSPSACLLDSVDVFVDIFGTDAVVALLFRLKDKFPVLAICCEPSVNEEDFKRFLSAADSTIKVQMREGQCVADTVVYKRNGKCTNLTEAFTLSEDLRISSIKYVPSESSHVDPQVTNTEESFDMELKLREKELIAKKQLGLPFTSVTKQSELVTLRMADRKVRVGGQIIYTPDKEDDLDDSDPDDDLNL